MKKLLNFIPSTKKKYIQEVEGGSEIQRQELAFMVPENSMQASKGDRQPIALPCYDAYEPHR